MVGDVTCLGMCTSEWHNPLISRTLEALSYFSVGAHMGAREVEFQ